MNIKVLSTTGSRETDHIYCMLSHIMLKTIFYIKYTAPKSCIVVKLLKDTTPLLYTATHFGRTHTLLLNCYRIGAASCIGSTIQYFRRNCTNLTVLAVKHLMGLLFHQTCFFFISAFIKKDERNTGEDYTTDTVRFSSNIVRDNQFSGKRI